MPLLFMSVNNNKKRLLSVILLLYVRDTELRCKNTNLIVNKRITFVKILIPFNKIQQILLSITENTAISR